MSHICSLDGEGAHRRIRGRLGEFALFFVKACLKKQQSITMMPFHRVRISCSYSPGIRSGAAALSPCRGFCKKDSVSAAAFRLIAAFLVKKQDAENTGVNMPEMRAVSLR